MNNFHNEDLLDLAKQKNQERVVSQQVQKDKQSTSHNNNRLLAALGAWMVKKGEKLQARYAASLQTNRLEFSQGKAKKTRA